MVAVKPRKLLLTEAEQSSKNHQIEQSVEVKINPIETFFKTVELVPQWFKDRSFIIPAYRKYRFARNSNKRLFLIFKDHASQHVRDFLRATARGDEETALRLLTINPGLLMERGHIKKGFTTDYSGRKYSGMTAFQIALCAGDEDMAMKMKDIYLKAYPETGQAELDAQFDEIFPDGYEAHLAAQEASADEFERDYINPLIEAIDGADAEDLTAALNKENNGSTLCQALDQFRTAFTTCSQNEVVFNPFHLLKILEKYNAKFNEWNEIADIPHDWLQLDLFWRQIIGFMQRFMPANYGQAFCTGLYHMIKLNQPLDRSLNLDISVNRPLIHLFPLDAEPDCRLGFDFAIYSYPAGTAGAEAEAISGGGCLPLFQDLCRTKITCLSNYAAEIEARRVLSSNLKNKGK